MVPVEIDGQVHQVIENRIRFVFFFFYGFILFSCLRKIYVTKRPHVDEFLRRVGELYECVLFTASLSKV